MGAWVEQGGELSEVAVRLPRGASRNRLAASEVLDALHAWRSAPVELYQQRYKNNCFLGDHPGVQDDLAERRARGWTGALLFGKRDLAATIVIAAASLRT